MKKYYICGSARVGFRIPVFVEDDRKLSDPQKVKYLINNKLQNLEGDTCMARELAHKGINVESGIKLQNGSTEYFDRLTGKVYATDENGDIRLERGF